MARIPINGQSHESISVDANAQRTVNWYPEADPTGKDELVLYPTPGFGSAFGSAGGGPVRAAMDMNGTMYVVSGNNFYSVDINGNASSIGTLTTSSGYVEMAHNGDEIIIVDGSQGCYYKESITTYDADITTNIDANFPTAATTVAFIDGYFVVNDPENTNAAASPGAFFISGSYDGTAWAALDYDVAERSWDQINAIRVANGQLWLIGEESTEVWWNSGNADFPFERIPSAVIEAGTISTGSAVQIGNSLIWLDQSDSGEGQVVMTEGYNLKPITTPALAAQIRGYTRSDARAFSMTWDSHEWYVLTFPTSNKTWVYDVTTGMWFQWSTNGDNARHISECYCYFNNKHYIGSRSDGAIYQLDGSVYDDNGTAITRLRQTPHLHFQGRWGYIGALELIMEQGVGTISVTDPQVMLQWSKDRGHTWSSESWRDILGNVGEYSKSTTWRQLGRCQDIIFRIKVTDAVKAVLVGGYMRATVGELDVS